MKLRVYFYDRIPVEERLKGWEKGLFPGHLLYGLTHFGIYGIEHFISSQKINHYQSRFSIMLKNTFLMLFEQSRYDVIYAMTFRGLELIILLRALNLLKKPIVLWHHTAVTTPKNVFRKFFSKLFYRGIDKFIFFSEALRNKSLNTNKVSESNSIVVHWGADMDFYNSLAVTKSCSDHFISTGRENRDFVTLIKAFNKTPFICKIYTSKQGGVIDYEKKLFQEYNIAINPNVHFSFVEIGLKELAEKVKGSFAVVICCLEFPYTVGLTTLVEAIALGIPVIVTDNPTYPFDVEEEKVGIKVPYGDVSAWEMAITHLAEHPNKAKEMGENGRKLAEKYFNMEKMASEVCAILLGYKKKSR